VKQIIKLEDGVIAVRGKGFTPGTKLLMQMIETAANGDRRSARYRPSVAGPDREGNPHPVYEHGEVHFTEPLLFGTGKCEVIVWDGDEVVSKKVFKLG
jgi:hypothetical protein